MDRIESPSAPADGNWAPLEIAAGFALTTGPFYATSAGLLPLEPRRYGFRVMPYHCNQNNVCHGGMLATFVDICCGNGALHDVSAASTLTISLTIDYLAAVPAGAWIESRIRILRRTRRLTFVETLLICEAEAVVRGSAVFRAA